MLFVSTLLVIVDYSCARNMFQLPILEYAETHGCDCGVLLLAPWEAGYDSNYIVAYML